MKQVIWVGMAAIGAVIALPSYAQAPAPAAQPVTAAPPQGAPAAPAIPENCKPLLTIATNYAIGGDSFNKAKEELDSRLKRIEDYVGAQKMGKFQVESMSFSIRHDVGGQNMYMMGNAQMNKLDASSPYKLTGTAEFQVDSSENAFKLGQFLTQEKFEVVVSNKEQPNPLCQRNNMMNNGGMNNGGMNKPASQMNPLRNYVPEQMPKPADAQAIPVPTGTPPQAEK